MRTGGLYTIPKVNFILANGIIVSRMLLIEQTYTYGMNFRKFVLRAIEEMEQMKSLSRMFLCDLLLEKHTQNKACQKLGPINDPVYRK